MPEELTLRFRELCPKPDRFEEHQVVKQVWAILLAYFATAQGKKSVIQHTAIPKSAKSGCLLTFMGNCLEQQIQCLTWETTDLQATKLWQFHLSSFLHNTFVLNKNKDFKSFFSQHSPCTESHRETE